MCIRLMNRDLSKKNKMKRNSSLGNMRDRRGGGRGATGYKWVRLAGKREGNELVSQLVFHGKQSTSRVVMRMKRKLSNRK